MPLSAEEVHGLCETYRQTRAELEALPDPTERDVGLASLRLEATATYRQLVTTAAGLPPGRLAPLETYVANLVGGEAPERWVGTIDAQAEAAGKKVLQSLLATLSSGVLVGVLGTIAGVVTVILTSGEALGLNIGSALLTGTVSAGVLLAVGRGLYAASQQVGESWLQTTGWAEGLGRQADLALGRAREAQRRVLARATGAAWNPAPFTAKARSRAVALVWLTWILLSLAAVLFVVGFFQGCSQALENSQQTLTQPLVP